MTIKSTIKHRRGTTSEWVVKNPILNKAEIGVDLDTGKFKLGDGETPWFIADTVQGFAIDPQPTTNRLIGILWPPR